jgi:hypothetical protein
MLEITSIGGVGSGLMSDAIASGFARRLDKEDGTEADCVAFSDGKSLAVVR